MHGSYGYGSPDDKVKSWQTGLHYSNLPQSIQAQQPISSIQAYPHIQGYPPLPPGLSYTSAIPPPVYPMAMPHRQQSVPPVPIASPAYHYAAPAPAQEVAQLSTGALDWEQYIQDNWQERQTAPADLAKFRSPSNIRGAPLEAEVSISTMPLRSHNRMDTVNSIASTVFESAFGDTYNFVDPLRRDSNPIETGPFNVLEADSTLTASMTAPLSNLMLNDGMADPLSHLNDAPALAGQWQPQVSAYMDASEYSALHASVSMQTQPLHSYPNQPSTALMAPSAFTFANSSSSDSRRTSSATVSSMPLLSPEDYLYAQAPGGALYPMEPPARGFLGSSHVPPFQSDYFVEPFPMLQAEQWLPDSQTPHLLPVPQNKASHDPSGHVSGPAAHRQALGSYDSSFIPYKRRRVASVSIPVRSVAMRKRASSTLRVPFLHDTQSTSAIAEGSPRTRAKRLTSPVASIRPADTNLDSSTIVDEETSADEADTANGEVDDETIPVEAGYIPVPALATYGSQAPPKVANRRASRMPSVPSVLRTVESVGGSSSASANGNGPEDDDDDNKARKQKLRFPEDLYTPLWVKGSATQKEGLCDMCPAPGKWLQLKNSAFWYHKQFTHGISSVSGARFTLPTEIRKNEAAGTSEGLCHQCQQWITYTTKRQDASDAEIVPTLWYKHAHKCHTYDSSKGKNAAVGQRSSRAGTSAGKKRRNGSADSGDYE